MALFPDKMKMNGGGAMTIESIAAKLTYFENQIQLIHWETTSHAEHSALNFYDTVHSFKDEVMEKLMGYMGRRPSGFKVDPILPGQDSTQVVTEVKEFAHELMQWGEDNMYCDISNIAQTLSGEAAKTLYLLTQS